MAKYGYPATSTHKVAHDAFVREVEIQVRKLDGGTQDDALKFYFFIVNWVLMHIACADRIWGKGRFIRFLFWKFASDFVDSDAWDAGVVRAGRFWIIAL